MKRNINLDRPSDANFAHLVRSPLVHLGHDVFAKEPTERATKDDVRSAAVYKTPRTRGFRVAFLWAEIITWAEKSIGIKKGNE